MREIEFRAKTKTNKWVFGNYYICDRQPAIQMNFLRYFINPKTLGQYTELIDKNGTKIFEGDIIKVNGESYTEQWKDIGVVEYFKGAFGVSYENGKHFLAFNNMSMYVRGYEVIGNIYDNPELLNT